MVRNLLTIGVFVLILGTSNAQASRARNIVLGTGDAGVALNGGSLLYEDEYNIFYNPAYLNDFKNWAIIEKSNFPSDTAQGGFTQALFNFAFGFYLNRGNAVVTNPGLAGGQTQDFAIQPIRPIEFFFAADMGYKFGLGLSYASGFTAGGVSSDVGITLGAIIESFEPFVTLRPWGREPNTKHTAYRVGTRYRWGEWKPFGVVTVLGDKPTNLADQPTFKEVAWGLGMTRSSRVGEGVSLNYGVGYFRVSDYGGANEGVRKIIPISFSVEGEAASWLSLLGGLSFNFFDRLNPKDGSPVNVEDATAGRLGAVVRINRVSFEWAIGKRTAGTANQLASLGGSETDTSTNSQTFDLANGFFTAANLTYRW